MKKIRILTSQQHIDEACHILYEVYINKMQWNFEVDNPSKIRVEIKNNKNILIDRFTDKSVWFGAFDGDKLIGCARIQGVDENNELELEKYENSKITHQYLPFPRNKCIEINKFAILPEHLRPGIIKRLFLSIFRFCDQKKYSVIGCTHNSFLKNFFLKIDFPLKQEQAFKYEQNDPAPVNFYFADHEKMEVANIINLLELASLNEGGANKTLIFKALEIVAPVLPAPVYWHNRSGVVLGINEHCLKAMGTTREIIGKSPYEFYPKETADHILNHHNMVMDKGHVLAQEEKINDITTGKEKYFSSIKAPLYDDDGSVVGIVGTSIEITAEKERERLKQENERLELENKFQNKLIVEQNNFKEIINQAVHDIRSPLASLLILSKYANNMPKEVGDIINGSAQRINDIANNLLTKYWNENTVKRTEEMAEVKNSFQVSLALQKILSEKKYEFYDHPVEFAINIDPVGYLIFLWAEEISFSRLISNVINNAVEALEKKPGIVTVNLKVSDSSIVIIIEDTGKGMAPHIIDKIKNKIPVTEGKKKGHGIGYAQIRGVLQRNNGHIDIESTPGEGTKVSLSFMKSIQPEWIAKKIVMRSDDSVIVVDDDPSILRVWEMRLKDEYPNIRLKYFMSGLDAIKYIGNFSSKEKEKILLLADYELLDQAINGLEVIKETNLQRSLLVTNRFSNKELQAKLTEAKVQMLPKLCIPEIPINVL